MKYSACQLTKPEDKLIDMSGVAKQMASVPNDEHIAGMWRVTLTSELLGYVRNARDVHVVTTSHTTRYRAPSSSWASSDSDVTTAKLKDVEPLYDVSDAKIMCTTSDMTGCVTGDVVSLNGTLKHIKFVQLAIRTWNMSFEEYDLSPIDDEESQDRPSRAFLDVQHNHGDDWSKSENLYCMPARIVNGTERLL